MEKLNTPELALGRIESIINKCKSNLTLPECAQAYIDICILVQALKGKM